MAQKIERSIVLPGRVCRDEKCEIQIACAIGLPDPVSVNIDCFGTENQEKSLIEKYVMDSYDLTAKGIIKHLRLREADYNKVSAYGHFGEPEMPWEN